MPDINLMPISGMNTESEDKALFRPGDSKHFVRDALNVQVNGSGEVLLRPGAHKVSETPFRSIWQSPLHRDVFAVVGDKWVKVDLDTWDYEELATIGDGEAYHIVLNNLVVAAGANGLFSYNGTKAQRMTLDTPPAPMVHDAGNGSLDPGAYGVAISWLRGTQESAVSEMATLEAGPSSSAEITIPMSLDASVEGFRLYMTEANGSELRVVGNYPITQRVVTIPSAPNLGRVAQFRHLSPMPTGHYLAYWRGRLLTAKSNVLRMSEPLLYALHDERHGFVMMPQRITFVQPVAGGIWVGQVDHVAFLAGTSPSDIAVMRMPARAPVPGSAVYVHSDDLPSGIVSGSGGVVLWLAENGYVAGTEDGQLIEIHKGVMGGITGQFGTSVVLDRRITTTVI